MANPFVAWCRPTPLPCKTHQDPYGSWATGRALSPGSPQGFPRRPCAGRGSARPVARPGRHPLIPSIFPRSPAGTRCPGRPPPEHQGPDFWVSTPSREEPPPRSLAGAVNASTLSDEAQPLRSPIFGCSPGIVTGLGGMSRRTDCCRIPISCEVQNWSYFRLISRRPDRARDQKPLTAVGCPLSAFPRPWARSGLSTACRDGFG